MIYVYAPAYVATSNGIRVIYSLVELLNKTGFEARVLCYESRRYDFKIPESIDGYVVYLDESRISPSDTDIVVYSDTIHDNPLNAVRVVRYLLNRPAVLTGRQIECMDTDYIAVYSKSIDPQLPQLFIMNDDREEILSSKAKEKRNTVCLYFGKVDRKELKKKVQSIRYILKKYKKVEIITRTHPDSREKLFDKIARSRLLISFDPLTNLCYEATLLGTPVLLADTSFFSWDGFNIPLWGIYTSYQDVVLHAEDVNLAFSEYERHLKSRELIVRAWAIEVFRHFEVHVDRIEEKYTNRNYELPEKHKIFLGMDNCLNGTDIRLENINKPADMDTDILFLVKWQLALPIVLKRIDFWKPLRIITKKLGIYESLRRFRHKISRKAVI